MSLNKQEKEFVIKLKIKEIHGIIYEMMKNNASEEEIQKQKDRISFFENMINDLID